MTEGVDAPPLYVLTLDAVRWGIETLTSRKVHPFFLAYLQLRRRAVEDGSTENIQPSWAELGEFLAVPGGPPKKPYYRPFWNGGGRTNHFWLNANLAGSYATSSIRAEPLKVVTVEESSYSLRPDHAQLAVEHLLYGSKLPALALAAFFYRDYGFTQDTPAILIESFQSDFGFLDGSSVAINSDYDVLVTNEGSQAVGTWFEEASEDVTT